MIITYSARLGHRRAEEVGDQKDWREDDETAEDTVADLLRSQRDRSNGDGLRIESLFVGGPEEHAVGDHGEEQRRHASGEPLCSSERRRLGSHADRQPHMIVDCSVKHVATH